MKRFLVSGVPQSVRMDGWWMSEPPAPTKPRKSAARTPMFARIIALLALVLAGDALLWKAAPGLSLALFGLLILVAVWLISKQRGTAGLAAATLLFLPLVEQAQALSLGFFATGLVVGVAWIALGRIHSGKPLYSSAIRFLLSAPLLSLRELQSFSDEAMSQARGMRLHLSLQAWALPLGFGLIFASLLLSANPMMSELVFASLRSNWISSEAFMRLFFWFGLALICLPFLLAVAMQERLKLPLPPLAPRPMPSFLNKQAIARSLVLFNVMFALQTTMDLVILWGGAGLPEGMSYATYAHRGAYPLLATALLAGLFSLLARPFTEQSPFLRAALLAWVVQNIFLVASSVYRLEAYVSAFGLTHLRIAAFIWMILVAIGLTVMIIQVLRQKPALWLVTRAALLGCAGLYMASFLSFSATIARYNLNHDVPLDRPYICQLGPHALPEILAYEARTGQRLCYGVKQARLEFADWREWGFRDWRLQRSLAALTEKDRH